MFEVGLIENYETEIATEVRGKTIEDLVYISALSMCRTNQIIKRLANNANLSGILCLSEYIERKMNKYEDLFSSVDNSEIDSFLEVSGEIIESIEFDDDVLYLAYELCETWFYFSHGLYYGFNQDDVLSMIDYIILPLQLIATFVLDEDICEADGDVVSDRRIEEEKKRIKSDLNKKMTKEIYFKYYSQYKELDILFDNI